MRAGVCRDDLWGVEERLFRSEANHSHTSLFIRTNNWNTKYNCPLFEEHVAAWTRQDGSMQEARVFNSTLAKCIREIANEG